MTYFSNFFSSKAIIAYFSVLMLCAWLFVPRFLPFIWILFGSISVVSFFYFSSLFTKRWAEIQQKSFQNKIFQNALIIRLTYVIFVYFFYYANNGNPYEFGAADGFGYNFSGNQLLDWFYAGTMEWYWKGAIREYGIGDAGWELTLAFIYLITFRSILMVRIFNAVVGAWMVVLIYKISQRNFGEQAARITAVMAMLLPTFIYFSGLHLKEIFMTFLLVAFIERSDNLLHSRNFTTKNIIQIVLLGISLFFFRTVLAVAAWFSLFSAFLLSSDKLMNQYRRIVVSSWLIIAALVFFSGAVSKDISVYLRQRTTNQTAKLEAFSVRSGGNKFARYGRASIFIPIIIPAPFPTLVNIPGQENLMMTNGDLFTRNVYVFFVFVAAYVLFKKKRLRKNLLLSVFLGSYLLILANSGFALSPRFHVPALPFLLLFAGYGITQTNRNYSSYYMLYLIGISTVVIVWNWFKLAGRGMV